MMEIESFVSDSTKIVDYFGIELCVPDWVEFIATDRCGAVYGYEMEPEACNGDNVFCALGQIYDLRTRIRLKDHKNTWKKSVVSVGALFVEGTLNLRRNKTADYFNLAITVPEYANYIATCKDGTIHAHEKIPRKEGDCWVSSGLCTVIGKGRLVNPDRWGYTLREVE